MFRRRRPLLRAAAVGGVAYAAGHHSATKSAEQSYMDAQQNAQIADLQQQTGAAPSMYQQPAPPPVYQQPAPPPAYQQPPAQPEAVAPEPSSSPGPDMLEQLKQLGELHGSGVLTDAEFEAAKKKILGQL